MVSTMLAYILILGMLLIGQAAPKKRGITDDDLVQLLNQRRDHEAWEMFRDDLMTSALPGDPISQAIAVMDAAHQEGTLLGDPGNSAGSGASNINAEPDSTNSDTPAGGEPSHAEGTPNPSTGPTFVPPEDRAAVMQQFANDDYSVQVQTAFRRAQQCIAQGRFTEAWQTVQPFTYLIDGNVHSCRYLLDVLAGRATLVNLEVQRPSSPALSTHCNMFLQVVTPNHGYHTKGNRGTDDRTCVQAQRNMPRSAFHLIRHRPWVKKLPMRLRRRRHPGPHARGLFAACYEKAKMDAWYWQWQRIRHCLYDACRSDFLHLTPSMYMPCKQRSDQQTAPREVNQSAQSPVPSPERVWT